VAGNESLLGLTDPILNPAIQEISNINITGNNFVFTVPESNPGSLINASSTPGVPYNESTPNSRANTFPQKSSLSFVDLLGIAWLIGAIMIVLYLVLVYASNVLKLNNGNNCSDPVIIKAIEKCKQEMGIRSKILIFYSRHVNTPSMFGLINPSLLVPIGILSALSDDEKRYVLLHELSHLKRRDLWMNWLTLLLRAVYWFNPVIWYAFAKMQEDCEVACDANVLQHLNKEEHPRYGETILCVLKTVSRPILLPVTTGMTNRKSSIKRRLAMITSFKRPSWKLSIVAVGLLALIGILGLTNSVNGSLFPSRSTGKTIVEAIQKSGRNVSKVVDTEEVKGGVVVFYKKAIGNGGVTNASGYIKKTLWGWEWAWGGEHSDSTPMGFSAQYFPYVKTTPFPLVFGEIKDPNVKFIDVSENGTTNKVQAKIVGTGTDLMWYVFLDKSAGPDFTITGLSNSGSILYTQSLNTNSSSSASAGVNITENRSLPIPTSAKKNSDGSITIPFPFEEKFSIKNEQWLLDRDTSNNLVLRIIFGGNQIVSFPVNGSGNTPETGIILLGDTQYSIKNITLNNDQASGLVMLEASTSSIMPNINSVPTSNQQTSYILPASIRSISISDDSPAGIYWSPNSQNSVLSQVSSWLKTSKPYAAAIPATEAVDAFVHHNIGPSVLHITGSDGFQTLLYPAWYTQINGQEVDAQSIGKYIHYVQDVVVLIEARTNKVNYLESVALYNWLKNEEWKTEFSQNPALAPQYQTNENGQTYGSNLGAIMGNPQPDLIAATGVDGTNGYVRYVDLMGNMPKTPEEALAMQNNRKPGSAQIPLYAIDGKTVIGVFNHN